MTSMSGTDDEALMITTNLQDLIRTKSLDMMVLWDSLVYPYLVFA